MRDLSSTTGAEGAHDDLGGRLSLLDPATIGGEQRRLYDRFLAVQVPWARDSGFEMCAREGRLIGPFNALLRAPEISNPFMDWEEALRESSGLSEEVRQVVTLAVGAEWNGEYEIYAHTAVARTAGLSDEVVRAIKEHRRPDGVSEGASAAYRRLTYRRRRPRPTTSSAPQQAECAGAEEAQQRRPRRRFRGRCKQLVRNVYYRR